MLQVSICLNTGNFKYGQPGECARGAHWHCHTCMLIIVWNLFKCTIEFNEDLVHDSWHNMTQHDIVHSSLQPCMTLWRGARRCACRSCVCRRDCHYISDSDTLSLHQSPPLCIQYYPPRPLQHLSMPTTKTTVTTTHTTTGGTTTHRVSGHGCCAQVKIAVFWQQSFKNRALQDSVLFPKELNTTWRLEARMWCSLSSSHVVLRR